MRPERFLSAVAAAVIVVAFGVGQVRADGYTGGGGGGGGLPLSGGTMTGDIDMSGNDIEMNTGNLWLASNADGARLYHTGLTTIWHGVDAAGRDLVLETNVNAGSDVLFNIGGAIAVRDGNGSGEVFQISRSGGGTTTVNMAADADALIIEGHSTMSAGSDLIVARQSDTTEVFTVDNNGRVDMAGDLVGTGADVGASAQSAANQACTTTCTSGACLIGFDTGTSAFVPCTSNLADTCVCLDGAS